MTDIAHRGGQSTAVATTGPDPYSALGARLSQEGTYLAFAKGEYVYGANKEVLRLGTRLIASMPGMRLGWRCWVAGKVIDDKTELLTDMLPVARREELGDHDKGLWELDDKGQPRDPWVMTYIVEVADQATGEVFLFSATSKGGQGAIGKLLKEYGREYRMRPDMLPVIELQRDSYMHSNKSYGKIYVPLLPIVGWVDAGGEAGAHELGEREVNPTASSANAHTPNAGSQDGRLSDARSDARTGFRRSRDDIDDKIPF